MWEAVRRGELARYSEVGHRWYGEDEIDIVGFAPEDDRILFAECKTEDPVGHSLVARLRDTTERVRRGPDTRDEELTLFSKSGFVDGLADDLDDEWSLFGPDRIETLSRPTLQ